MALVRLLNPEARIDYLIACAIGAWPICWAYVSGALHSVVYTCGSGQPRTYKGYLDFPNWWSLAALIPILLLAFRWVMGKIVPLHQPSPSAFEPPIIALLRDEKARRCVYTQLREKILSPANLWVALAIVAMVELLDIWPIVKPLLLEGHPGMLPVSSFDWFRWTSEQCTTDDPLTRGESIVLLISAQAAQASIVFLAVTAIILVWRHNIFFLRNVYQRRWVAAGKSALFFHIDPRDVNRCFGFRLANDAFNTQVQALILAGAAMFLSRYVHSVQQAGSLAELLQWPPVFPELSFPLPSQWLMALFWLIALVVVASPGMVKLLPMVPSRGNERVHLSIGNYLREFFSDETWPKNKVNKDHPVPVVAALFARNAFWPSGDNRAAVLFFFSYWIFFVILLPPSVHDPVYLAFSLVVFGALAYGAKAATFAALEICLGYIDRQLVNGSEPPPPPADIRIFISYRRRDSAEYARSLESFLEEKMGAGCVFRDIADIRPGENFVQAVDEAIERVDAVIVLIGPDWLDVRDQRGRPRLHDPEDMVAMEVTTARRRGKRIYPVLVGGARMPKATELPASLKDLTHINAVEISDTRWDHDTKRLLEALSAPVA